MICSHEISISISNLLAVGKVFMTTYSDTMCRTVLTMKKYTLSSYCRPDESGYYVSTHIPGVTTLSPVTAPTPYPVIASYNNGEYKENEKEKKSTCFAGSETLLLESGIARRISEINVGDRILAADSLGKTAFTEVRKEHERM